MLVELGQDALFMKAVQPDEEKDGADKKRRAKDAALVRAWRACMMMNMRAYTGERLCLRNTGEGA